MARLIFNEKKPNPYDPKKYKVVHKNHWRQVNLLLQPSNKNWWEDPDVIVAFNLPRISARLERLMGTNVVKLTDRAYMKELRDRIDEDYRKQLQERIRAREMKEVERERMLIIEGKTDVIPEELADDPIFMVNKDANIEIQKERSKLKTSREKNAERLKVQGMKWERERLQHAAKEADVQAKKRERQRQQKVLMEQFRDEDAERGMDLLRIHNEDWRECEQGLKEFLELEREKMKKRSLLVPTAYSSDPKDIRNIVRARQKFRETELRIRHQLDDKTKDAKVALTPMEHTVLSAKVRASAELQSLAEQEKPPILADPESFEELLPPELMDDVTDVSNDSIATEEHVDLALVKQQYAEQLQADMEDEFNHGLLISKQQYDELRFEDEKIVALRNAKDICELYQLADQIIMGEKTIEYHDEEDEEEEQGEEEEEALLEAKPSSEKDL